MSANTLAASIAEPTGGEGLAELVTDARAAFDSGTTRPAAWRFRQLEGLARLLEQRQADILEALRADLGKPSLEAYTAEVGHVLAEIAFIRKRLRSWMRPEKVRTPLYLQPGRSVVRREPLGLVLIIGPWNFPVQLVLSPLAGALAAGNAAIVKPSELAPATSALLADVLPRYVDAEAVRVVQGGADVSTALLEQRFDHIFFTGGARVGKLVMQAAAKNLVPVTLELGGKSPCIVDESADVRLAARRIAWGKFFNAGQVCVAPDYVLAHERIFDAFLGALATSIRAFYGPDPRHSEDYGRIVNDAHFQRVAALIDSGTVVIGGQTDPEDRYIAPTVLRDVQRDSDVMRDEIFGPVLPVLRVDSVEEAVTFVNGRPKPLALYVFALNKKLAEYVLGATSSGGATVNHTWMHVAVPGLPFGGVGQSGMGAYHGRSSFETFTHRKAVLYKSTAVDPALLYPPYHPSKMRSIKSLL